MRTNVLVCLAASLSMLLANGMLGTTGKNAGSFSVLDLMRNTPLVRLHGRARTPRRANLWAKLELAMPGQMKDRVALHMRNRPELFIGYLSPAQLAVTQGQPGSVERLVPTGVPLTCTTQAPLLPHAAAER